jgi:flagellar biosynthetic protein FliO
LPDQLFFDIVKMVLALSSVVALVFAVVWLLKRFLPGATRAASERVDMYMIGQLAVGSRQRVAVVRVHDRILVLGITEGSINTLADLTPPKKGEAKTEESPKDADDPKIFADLLAWPKDTAAKSTDAARQPAGASSALPDIAAPGPVHAPTGNGTGAIDKDAIRDLFDSLSGPPK